MARGGLSLADASSTGFGRTRVAGGRFETSSISLQPEIACQA